MGRIAGDDPGYTFRLCRVGYEDVQLTPAEILKGGSERKKTLVPTEHGFELVSVSTFLGEVMGKPASAMAWWGFRIGMTGLAEALAAGEAPAGLDAEDLEALLKERGVNPNMKLEQAGDRGSAAHEVLELLADGSLAEAEKAAWNETREFGTEYGYAVIEWWNEQIQPSIDDGQILEVRSEVPVWSIKHWFAGTFDLALLWSFDAGDDTPRGWEILDLKTHKPAQGFTLAGKGAGYYSEAAQIRAYRMAWEEMGLGDTIGQRTVIARDKAYRGVRYLEDAREVPEELVVAIRQAYDVKVEFEKGDE